jgi:hypothetical protein
LAAAAAPLMGSIAAAEDAPLRERHGLRLYAATRLTIEIADANQFEFEKGLGGVAAAGIEIGERWRFEFAFSRRSTNITGIPPLPADGSFSTWTHMANAFWHPLGLGPVDEVDSHTVRSVIQDCFLGGGLGSRTDVGRGMGVFQAVRHRQGPEEREAA